MSKILDWWLAPQTFTTTMKIFPVYILVSVYALFLGGLVPLLLWAGLGLAWWVEASLTVCRRCKHYGTWHCAGQGMLVSKLFSRRPAGLPRWRIVAHFVLDAIAFLFPQYWIITRLGGWVSLLSMLFLVFMIVASVPRKGASYAKPFSA